MKTQLQTVLIACFWMSSAAAAAPQPLLLAQASQLFGGDPSSSMQIDILPEAEVNIIGRNAGREIPVAILGSESLDVVEINPRTIRLEGVDVRLVGKSDKSLCRKVDVNDDEHLDLLCDVRTTGFRVKDGSYRILLKAETYDKTSLRGSDQLRICLLYTSPSPRDGLLSRMPSSA